LADLASKDRTPSEAKRFAAEAQTILHDLAELDEKLSETDGDYSDDLEVHVPIVQYLNKIKRSATVSELTEELIRGRFPGYRDKRRMAIRVGRSVRSYDVGKPSENPKLKLENGLVGLPSWPNKMFS
jgi:hypothetical protein